MSKHTEANDPEVIELVVVSPGTNRRLFFVALALALIRLKLTRTQEMEQKIYDWAWHLKGVKSDDAATVIIKLRVQESVIVDIADGDAYEKWIERRRGKAKTQNPPIPLAKNPPAKVKVPASASV